MKKTESKNLNVFIVVLLGWLINLYSEVISTILFLVSNIWITHLSISLFYFFVISLLFKSLEYTRFLILTSLILIFFLSFTKHKSVFEKELLFKNKHNIQNIINVDPNTPSQQDLRIALIDNDSSKVNDVKGTYLKDNSNKKSSQILIVPYGQYVPSFEITINGEDDLDFYIPSSSINTTENPEMATFSITLSADNWNIPQTIAVIGHKNLLKMKLENPPIRHINISTHSITAPLNYYENNNANEYILKHSKLFKKNELITQSKSNPITLNTFSSTSLYLNLFLPFIFLSFTANFYSLPYEYNSYNIKFFSFILTIILVKRELILHRFNLILNSFEMRGINTKSLYSKYMLLPKWIIPLVVTTILEGVESYDYNRMLRTNILNYHPKNNYYFFSLRQKVVMLCLVLVFFLYFFL